MVVVSDALCACLAALLRPGSAFLAMSGGEAVAVSSRTAPQHVATLKPSTACEVMLLTSILAAATSSSARHTQQGAQPRRARLRRRRRAVVP